MQCSLITVADDFGLSPAVNAAVELAVQKGILTSASLMVGATHAGDAVERAHALGGRLKVGLHLVVIEGPAILPPSSIPDLVDRTGGFPGDQLRLGLRYGFSPGARRQLAAEIRAQFEAFRKTGLRLDHANAHKHMHLHPVVGSLMISIGREFGLRAIRVPAEPANPGARRRMGDRALYGWTKILRAQARRAGLITNDRIAGLSDTGHMTASVVQRLLEGLAPGLTEMYFHPATERDQILRRLMPRYDHEGELKALLSAPIPAGVHLTSYTDIARPLG